MSQYRLRPRADRDLADIWRYTATRWDAAQADQYVVTILGAIQALARDSGAAHALPRIWPGYKRAFVGSHAIYFRVQGNSDIEIIRILHQSMDADRHLK